MHRDIASMVPLQLLPCIVGPQPASHRVCSYFCNNCFSDTGTRNRRSISSCILQSIPCSFFMQRSLHGPTAMSSVAASKAGVVITSIVAARSVASLPRGPVLSSAACSVAACSVGTRSVAACSVAAELASLGGRRCRPGDPSAIVAHLVPSLTHCAVWSPLPCVPALRRDPDAGEAIVLTEAPRTSPAVNAWSDETDDGFILQGVCQDLQTSGIP